MSQQLQLFFVWYDDYRSGQKINRRVAVNVLERSQVMDALPAGLANNQSVDIYRIVLPRDERGNR